MNPTNADLKAISQMESSFANRIFLTQGGPVVKLSFAEQWGTDFPLVPRASVILLVSDVMALAKMLSDALDTVQESKH